MGRYGLHLLPGSSVSLHSTNTPPRIQAKAQAAATTRGRKRDVKNTRRPLADVTPAKVKTVRVTKAKAQEQNDDAATQQEDDDDAATVLEGLTRNLSIQAIPTPMPPGAWPRELGLQKSKSIFITAPLKRKVKGKTSRRTAAAKTPKRPKLAIVKPIEGHCPAPPESAATFSFDRSAPFSWSPDRGFMYWHEHVKPTEPPKERSKSPVKWLPPPEEPTSKKADPVAKRLWGVTEEQRRWFAKTKLDLDEYGRPLVPQVEEEPAAPRRQAKAVGKRVKRVVPAPETASPTPAPRRRVKDLVQDIEKRTPPKVGPIRIRIPVETQAVHSSSPATPTRRLRSHGREEPSSSSPTKPRYSPYTTTSPTDTPASPSKRRTTRRTQVEPPAETGAGYAFNFVRTLFGRHTRASTAAEAATESEQVDEVAAPAYQKFLTRWEHLTRPGLTYPLTLSTIPWPVENLNSTTPTLKMIATPSVGELTVEAVGGFLQGGDHLSRKQRLQDTLRLYKEKHFNAVVNRIMSPHDKEVARTTAKAVVSIIGRLMEEEMA